MKRTDLHEYQNYCVDFLKTHAEAMLILEMGLGKSAISLTAIADLMFDSFDVGKTLVIAPLRVAKTVWPEERAGDRPGTRRVMDTVNMNRMQDRQE